MIPCEPICRDISLNKKTNKICELCCEWFGYILQKCTPLRMWWMGIVDVECMHTKIKKSLGVRRGEEKLDYMRRVWNPKGFGEGGQRGNRFVGSMPHDCTCGSWAEGGYRISEIPPHATTLLTHAHIHKIPCALSSPTAL